MCVTAQPRTLPRRISSMHMLFPSTYNIYMSFKINKNTCMSINTKCNMFMSFNSIDNIYVSFEIINTHMSFNTKYMYMSYYYVYVILLQNLTFMFGQVGSPGLDTENHTNTSGVLTCFRVPTCFCVSVGSLH